MKHFELVLIGHPDKVCDGIANVIKDANPNGRNAIEVCWFNDTIVIGGETDKVWSLVGLETYVNKYLNDVIGVNCDEPFGIRVINKLNTQSNEIDDIAQEDYTGDNGIFYGGYDKTYTPVIDRMKRFCAKLDKDTLNSFGYKTDGKFIFSVYPNGDVARMTLNVAADISEPHEDELRKFIFGKFDYTLDLKINPKGNWYKCFGFADAGLTNRKIACDTQCGLFHNGGGGLMGKDLSKPDVTINLWLTQEAKIECLSRKLQHLELKAYSVIGDKIIHVTSATDGVNYSKYVDFNQMKQQVKKINVFGGIIDE